MARILLIEDEPEISSLLKRALNLKGHQPILASNGREGLLRQLVEPAELIMIDVYMPTADGLETMVELRRRFPRLPMIAICGRKAAFAVMAIAQTIGDTAVLEKPFGAEEAVAMVESTLRPASVQPTLKDARAFAQV